MQRNVTALHDRASANREFVAAVVAQEHTALRLAFHAADAERTTMLTGRLAIPARSFDMGECVFVVEDRISDVRSHAPLWALVSAK